jgi:hypothetical protein
LKARCYSINVQAVCDSNLIIKNVVCRWPGWSHDYTIFRNSRLRAYLENRIYGEGSVVVGDSGYRLKSYNITPLANPRTAAENLFKGEINFAKAIYRYYIIIITRFIVNIFAKKFLGYPK